MKINNSHNLICVITPKLHKLITNINNLCSDFNHLYF